MQKGTVCGADRSVYKLHFLRSIFDFFFFFSILQCAIFLYKGLAGLTETFRFLTETSSLSDIDKRVGTVAIHCS